MYFKANCMILASRAEVICPNVGLFIVAFGLPNLLWFRTLNASHRKSIFRFSATGNDRDNAMSTFQPPGPRRMPRPSLPKTPTAGIAKALTSN